MPAQRAPAVNVPWGLVPRFEASGGRGHPIHQHHRPAFEISSARPRSDRSLTVNRHILGKVCGFPAANLQDAKITVTEQADYRNVIGPPKSQSGFRTIPVPPMGVKALPVWKLACPPSPTGLVFPSSVGTPIYHPNVVLQFQEPLQIAAGLTRQCVKDGKPVVDKDGAPVLEGIDGLHDLRHACASLWIEQRIDAKRVQSWMGHHSISVTFDTYGHLFAALEDDAAAMSAIEAGVMITPSKGEQTTQLRTSVALIIMAE